MPDLRATGQPGKADLGVRQVSKVAARMPWKHWLRALLPHPNDATLLVGAFFKHLDSVYFLEAAGVSPHAFEAPASSEGERSARDG